MSGEWGRFDELASRIVDLARSGAIADPQPPVLVDRGLLARLDGATRALEERTLVLALIGEFSGGKSMVLEALFDCPGTFPTGLAATTAVPVEVRRAVSLQDDRAITVWTASGRQRRVNAEQLRALMTDRTLPLPERLTKVEVRLLSNHLPEGVRVVELPGLGSTHLEHDQITNSYLDHVHAAVLVTAGSTPSASEELLLRRLDARGLGDATVVACTAANAKLSIDHEAREQRFHDTLTRVSGEHAADAVVSVDAAGYLHARDDDDRAESGIPALRAVITHRLIARTGRLLSSGALAAVEQVLAAAHESAESRQKWLVSETKERLHSYDQVRSQLDGFRLAELPEAPQWEKLKKDLTQAVLGRQRNLRQELDRLHGAVLVRVGGVGGSAIELARQLVNEGHDYFSAFLGGVKEDLDRITWAAADELGVHLCRLSMNDWTGAPWPAHYTVLSSPAEPAELCGRSRWERVAKASVVASQRGRVFWAVGGGTGALLVLLFPPAGVTFTSLMYAMSSATAAGAAVGAALDVAVTLPLELRELDKRTEEERLRILRQYVQDLIRDSQLALDKVSDAGAELANIAAGELQEAIAAGIEHCDAELRAMAADSEISAQQAKSELTVLEGTFEQLAALGARHRELLEQISARDS